MIKGLASQRDVSHETWGNEYAVEGRGRFCISSRRDEMGWSKTMILVSRGLVNSNRASYFLILLYIARAPTGPCRKTFETMHTQALDGIHLMLFFIRKLFVVLEPPPLGYRFFSWACLTLDFDLLILILLQLIRNITLFRRKGSLRRRELLYVSL